jgi:hypothetical protein
MNRRSRLSDNFVAAAMQPVAEDVQERSSLKPGTGGPTSLLPRC